MQAEDCNVQEALELALACAAGLVIDRYQFLEMDWNHFQLPREEKRAEQDTQCGEVLDVDC